MPYLMLFFLLSFLMLLRSQQPVAVFAACMTAWVLGVTIFSLLEIGLLLTPDGATAFAESLGERIIDGLLFFPVLAGVSVLVIWAKRNYVTWKAARRRGPQGQ